MASIHRRPNTQNWHGAFYQGGKLVFRSTGTPDKALARRIADEWELLSKEGEAGTLLESQVRDVIASIVKRAGVDAPGIKPPTVGEFAERWLEAKLHGLAHGSAWSYRKAVDSFLEFIEKRRNLPIGAIQPPDTRAFIAHLQSQNYATKSITVYVRVVSAIFIRAVNDRLITSNPFAGALADNKRGGKGGAPHKREPFTPTEVGILIQTAIETAPDWGTAVMLGAYTGARLRDCCRMKWEDLNLSSGTLTLIPLKTGVEMTLPIHPALQEHLEKRASSIGDRRETLLTPTLSESETGGTNGLSDQFGRIMRKAGISAGKTAEGTRRKQNSRGFHSLRHSFVSALANADVPAELRMKLSGHADVKVHQGYTKTELDTLARSVAKLPAF